MEYVGRNGLGGNPRIVDKLKFKKLRFLQCGAKPHPVVLRFRSYQKAQDAPDVVRLGLIEEEQMLPLRLHRLAARDMNSVYPSPTYIIALRAIPDSGRSAADSIGAGAKEAPIP